MKNNDDEMFVLNDQGWQLYYLELIREISEILPESERAEFVRKVMCKKYPLEAKIKTERDTDTGEITLAIVNFRTYPPRKRK